MKTRELIRQLQEADPSGEIECCIGNEDIFYIDRMPAYYDGVLQVLVRDKTKEPYYDVIGGKFISSGEKIKIVSLSIEDALYNDETMSVEFADEYSKRHCEESVVETRKEVFKMKTDNEWRLFKEWVDEQSKKIFPNHKVIEYGDIQKFFDLNIKYNDPIPEDIRKITQNEPGGHKSYLSYVQCRTWQWDREIKIISTEIDEDHRVHLNLEKR